MELAIGLSIGLSILGFLILVSVFAVLITWQGKNSYTLIAQCMYTNLLVKKSSPDECDDVVCAENATSGAGEKEMEMNNSIYDSQTVNKADDDRIYDSIA